jgi:hypothetical protein
MQLTYRGLLYQPSEKFVDLTEAEIQLRYRGQSYSVRGMVNPSELPVTKQLRYLGISYTQ